MREITIISMIRGRTHSIRTVRATPPPDWKPAFFQTLYDSCLYLMSMTFGQEYPGQQDGEGAASVSGWAAMDLVYESVSQELSAYVPTSGRRDERHLPLAYAVLDGTGLPEEGAEDPRADLQAIWAVSPHDCIKFGRLVKSRSFQDRFSELGVKVQFKLCSRARRASKKAGRHMVELMSQPRFIIAHYDTLRVYPDQGYVERVLEARRPVLIDGSRRAS